MPMTPTTPTSPSPQDPKPKRPNPLTDLVDTEKSFVDQLTGIIRKVAAAWSRSNLPPPELDTMFRSIEGIYKANRGLHAKLKDISADPKSAGELGGLLIKWIDDLRKPYETYCAKYCCGFDSWQPVQSNQRLGPILAQFSATNPAPSNSGIWTLDSLFLLPKTRLKYYQKLYNRLLKNTDNRLLVGAVDTLRDLMATLDIRSTIKVGDQDSESSTTVAPEIEDEVVIDMRSQTLSPPAPATKKLRSIETEGVTGSETSSNHGSSVSGGARSSRESESTSMSRTSTQTLSMPISDLERRLVTNRTLDIFTMTPKAVKLQMSPPSLTFTRELRTSIDVVIRFTPRATGVEVVHRQGHIFLLSDLFLVCERMSPEDQSQPGHEGADMWLCYPPLAGKVLRVSEITGQDNAIQVAIMRKEFLVLETDTKEKRNILLAHFKESIEFSVPPPAKGPPPPMPPMSAFPRMQSDVGPTPSPTSARVGEWNGDNRSPPRQRIDSNGLSSFSTPPPPAYQPDIFPPQDGKNRSDPQFAPGPAQGPPHLRPSASAQPFATRSTSFGTNNGIPPARSTSHIPGNNEPAGGPSFLPPIPTYGNPPFANSPASYSPQQAPFHNNQAPFPNNQAPFHNNQPPYPNNMNSRPPNQYPPAGYPPPRPPSEPSMGQGIRKTPSTRSLASQYSQHDMSGPAPPLPSFPNGYQPNGMNQVPRNNSYTGLHAPQPRPMMPSSQIGARSVSMAEIAFNEPSPPNSPLQQPQNLGPVVSTVSAQMKCKVFLQQQHAQWKSLGSAKLKLYLQEPTNVKQLVVEADNREKSVLISTIVLTDGVERVGKTGIAIELSDKGSRTGVIYMIQLRNENSAGGLFDSLLAGSDRAARG
ncbi:hypothetical protein B0H34DRAFT_779517 [Crassisporium funariophilum]|nr:hypothetical protein B0H34DRAFT_779517 [Crassisporium funariophilum]